MPQLVLDEDVNRKIARELQRRGRPATSVWALNLVKLDGGTKDGQLLKALAALNDRCVLVTNDQGIDRAHLQELEVFGVAVAIIDEKARANTTLTREEYAREVIHRWGHLMAVQRPREIRRYSSTAPRKAYFVGAPSR